MTDRGRPVARIVPMVADAPRLSELERRGLLRGPTASLPDDFLDRPRPVGGKGSVRGALLQERSEGR